MSKFIAFGAQKMKGTSDKGKGSPYDFASLQVLSPASDFKNANTDIKVYGDQSVSIGMNESAFADCVKLPWVHGKPLVLECQTDVVMSFGKAQTVITSVKASA